MDRRLSPPSQHPHYGLAAADAAVLYVRHDDMLHRFDRQDGGVARNQRTVAGSFVAEPSTISDRVVRF